MNTRIETNNDKYLTINSHYYIIREGQCFQMKQGLRVELEIGDKKWVRHISTEVVI